jgi:hypothetical protein
MADNENVTIRIRVRADTKEIDKVQARLAALCKQADECGDKFKQLGNRFDDNDKSLNKTAKSYNKNTRQLNLLSKSGRIAANVFGKIFKLAMIGSAVETLALAAALSSVNALLKIGSALGRAWNATVRGVGVAAANAAAGVLTLVAAFTAAQRQFAAAQSAGRYGGSIRSASSGLRTLQSDSQLAVFGLESLTGAFAAASKNARVTSQTVAGLRGLSDFAVASGDMEKGLLAAANLVSMLQAGKTAGGTEVLAAAAELGPEFEKAYKNVLSTGKKTNEDLLKMFSSGELAEAAGISGGFAAVQGTLMGQLKAFATEFQVMFADLGSYFLEPLQQAFHEIRQIFTRLIVTISGNLSAFARGPFIDVVVGATEKLSVFLAKLFNEYLPKTEEVLNNFISGWNRFSSAVTGTFERFERFLRRFSDASAEVNKFLGTIFRAIGAGASDNFESFSELIMNNREEFQKFGEELGKLIRSIFDLFAQIRKLFFDALPALNGLVSAITTLVEGFTGLLKILEAIPGTLGQIISLMAMGGLLSLGTKGGRARAGAAMGRASKAGGGKALPAVGLALAGATATYSLSSNLARQYGTGAGVAGGVGGGALTGAGVGFMLGGPMGAAIGAIGGAIVGALVGWFSSNNVKKEVGKAGETLAKAYVSELDTLISQGYVVEAQALLSEGEQFILDQAERYSYSSEFTKKALEELGIESEKTYKKIDLFNRRVDDLARITGKSEREIIDTSRALGIDLTSELTTLQGVLQETGWAVGKFGDEFNAAISQAFGDAMGVLEQERLKLEVPAAVDEAFANAIESGFERSTLLDFLEQSMVAAQVYGEGDPLKAFDYLTQNLIEGLQFAQPGSRGFGQQQAFIEAGGEDLVREMLGTSGVGGAIIDQVISNALSSSATLGAVVDTNAIRDQMVAAMANNPALFLSMADKMRTPGYFEGIYAAGRETGPFTGTMAVTQALKDAGFTDVAVDMAASAQEQLTTHERMVNEVVTPFATAVTNFGIKVEEMADRLAAEFGKSDSGGGSSAADAAERRDRRRNQNQGSKVEPNPNVRQPRGDTSSPYRNLLDSVGTHMSLSSGIAGSRRITSGLRNYQLGSMSSDHRFGRALDIAGQNLGLYKSAVEAAGGYAGFHGWGGSRHLHVVPNNNAIGDTSVPYMGGGGGAATMVSSNDSYNITVNAAPGMDEKRIADEVMNRIQRAQRNAKERM